MFPTFCLCIPSYDTIPYVFLLKSRLSAPDKVWCVREDPPLRVPGLGVKNRVPDCYSVRGRQTCL